MHEKICDRFVMPYPAIYLLDNNTIHRQMIRFHLVRSGFRDTVVVPTIEELLYSLKHRKEPDFLIIEYNVIGHEPLGFLQQVRKEAPGAAIIFFTDHDDATLAGLLIRNGATDYILKGGNELRGLEELEKNLRYLATFAGIS